MNKAEQVFRLPPLPARPPESHKGTYGKVLLVAGSPGMAGAAGLAARAALRSGAGLVTVALPGSISAAVTACAPEATQLLLPEPGCSGYERQVAALLGSDLDERSDALAIGPGLGCSSHSRFLFEAVLERSQKAQVLDADALNLIAAGARSEARDCRVWTPHPGEFRRLAGNAPSGEAERISACETFVQKRRGVIVLKGHRTVVHDGERYFVNVTGNAGMATGGSGDVLTGIIVSLLAQSLEPFAAACLGVYLHGVAGDLAARSLGLPSVVASDMIDYLPDAQQQFAVAVPTPASNQNSGSDS